MSNSQPLVTRFAPSPTGHFHLGNVRTVLVNFLAARKAGGRFILRIEDTDATRSEDTYLQSLLADLHWLGIDWDEGPDMGGPTAPYQQSERTAIYDHWLAKLDAQGLTYPCYCSSIELSISHRNQIAAGKPPRYAGTCRQLTVEQRAEREARGLQPTVRFRVLSGKSIQLTDVVHGEQRFLSDDIGDFIVRRADGSSAFFCQSVKHNVTHPADIRPWQQVVFGELEQVSDEASAAIKEAGTGFFAAAIESLSKVGPELKPLTKDLGQTTGRKGPALFIPLRAALTGHTHGPELGPLLSLLGADKVRARFDTARASLM